MSDTKMQSAQDAYKGVYAAQSDRYFSDAKPTCGCCGARVRIRHLEPRFACACPHGESKQEACYECGRYACHCECSIRAHVGAPDISEAAWAGV